MKFRAQTESTLASYLKNAPHNATYVSKIIQNQPIYVIGDYLRKDLITEIKKAKYYSTLVNEVTYCSNKEPLSLAIRFVDEHSLIREEFLDFIEVEQITGESLANVILSHLESWDIPILNCRGQGYDGAANVFFSSWGSKLY